MKVNYTFAIYVIRFTAKRLLEQISSLYITEFDLWDDGQDINGARDNSIELNTYICENFNILDGPQILQYNA